MLMESHFSLGRGDIIIPKHAPFPQVITRPYGVHDKTYVLQLIMFFMVSL